MHVEGSHLVSRGKINHGDRAASADGCLSLRRERFQNGQLVVVKVLRLQLVIRNAAVVEFNDGCALGLFTLCHDPPPDNPPRMRR